MVRAGALAGAAVERGFGSVGKHGLYRSDSQSRTNQFSLRESSSGQRGIFITSLPRTALRLSGATLIATIRSLHSKVTADSLRSTQIRPPRPSVLLSPRILRGRHKCPLNAEDAARQSRNQNDSLSSAEWRRGPGRGGAFPAEQKSGPSPRSSPHSFVVGRGRKASRRTRILMDCTAEDNAEERRRISPRSSAKTSATFALKVRCPALVAALPRCVHPWSKSLCLQLPHFGNDGPLLDRSRLLSTFAGPA
jgi:hypothetical protein